MSSIDSAMQNDLENVSIPTIQPQIPHGTHPIITGKYTIYTNALCKVLDKILFWISINSPGAVVYGLQRIGKTTTIEIIKKRLMDEYEGALSVFSVMAHTYSRHSDGAFFSDIIDDLGFVDNSRAKPYEKRRQIVQIFENAAKAIKQNRVILIIDEAQLLKDLHYDLLMDIYNELKIRDITLTVILFGQMELNLTRAKFIRDRKMQIIGRFMCNETTLYGIQNGEDVRYCLDQLDNNKTFPKESKCFFTQYFFPEAYDQGYRLADDADMIFDVFYTVLKKNGISDRMTNIPMLYFILTITLCLKNVGYEGEGKYKPTKEDWKLAVEEAQLREFIF